MTCLKALSFVRVGDVSPPRCATVTPTETLLRNRQLNQISKFSALVTITGGFLSGGTRKLAYFSKEFGKIVYILADLYT